MRRTGPAALVLLGAALAAAPASHADGATHDAPRASRSAAGDSIALPFRVLRLDNGLVVVMHPDSAVPEVAVELWTRGGSREERAGEYGIAHLFEHDLPGARRVYSRAENAALYAKVSRDGNANTTNDFLRFFVQVAPEGLELALAATADRLASSTDSMYQPRLDRDRNIVLNELRRSDDTKWDPEMTMMLRRGTFGADHPYGHSISGVPDHIRAATLELMRGWHRRFIGASNAVLLIAGRFDPASTEALVRRYYASAPRGTPVVRAVEWVPRPSDAVRREVIEKGMPYGTVYLAWPVPRWGSRDGDDLVLLARVLAGGVGARLDRSALPEGSPLDSAFQQVELWEMAGSFTLGGTFRDPARADSVESVLRDALARTLRDGPTAAELARAKAQVRADFVRGLEELGFIGGRTEVLGEGMLFRDDPGFYRVRLAQLASATPERVRDAGRRWLSSSGYALHVLPRPRVVLGDSIDRAAVIRPGASAPARFPTVREARLANGLRVLLVERPELPLVEMTLAARAGSATDDAASAGRARLALAALERTPLTAEGATLATALGANGGSVEARIDPDMARLSVTVLREQVGDAAARLASLVTRRPGDAAILAARAEASERLARVADDPLQLRERALACALGGGGACDPSAIDGLGTRASLARLAPADVRDFIARRWVPSSSVMLVSGSITLGEAVPMLERAFAGWRGASAPPARGVEWSARPSGGIVILDRPGATQSYIYLAQPLTGNAASDALRARLVARALGSRVNDNLREAKQWSYGASGYLAGGRDRTVLWVQVPVQTDKTAEAITEIVGEVRRLSGDSAAPDLLARQVNALERQVAWSVTSLSDLDDRLLELARDDLPLDYHAQYLARVRALGPGALNEAARALLRPDAMTWVVVGDRARIEPALRALGMGEVRVVDPATLR